MSDSDVDDRELSVIQNALDPLSVGALALLLEAHSQTARNRQRLRILGPVHAHHHLMQPSKHRLRLHGLPFVHQDFEEAALMMKLPKRHATPWEGGRLAPITIVISRG